MYLFSAWVATHTLFKNWQAPLQAAALAVPPVYQPMSACLRVSHIHLNTSIHVHLRRHPANALRVLTVSHRLASDQRQPGQRLQNCLHSLTRWLYNQTLSM